MWRVILHHQPRLLPLVRSMCLSPNQIPSSQIKSSKWERLKLDLNCIDETILTSPRPSPSVKPKPKIQKRLKGNLASGLSLKSHGPPPITFRESGVQCSDRSLEYPWVSGRCPKSRWTAKGRTQVSPPCSSRTALLRSLSDSNWSS